MFNVIQSLIKTSWNPTVVFSLEVPICNVSVPLRTSEGKVRVKTDASKSNTAVSAMGSFNPPNRITLHRKSEPITATIISTQQTELADGMFSD